ncbi:MAG: hypothetical protein HGB32_15355 [Geobacteraceae bacterium]|nr:hypothetical protein [Geobacteraceae bacterium]NTW81500.1 hypothetical protein [Geobacteraceae bacterium]
MNADQIREIIREELQSALAAFFVAPVSAAPDQEAKDRLTMALRMPSLRAETERQLIAADARKARKLQKRAA